MITVKMLKQILEKMPDDAIIVSKDKSMSDYISDLGSMSLETIKFKNNDDVVYEQQVVNLKFFDIVDKITDLLYLDSTNFHCSPSILLKNIEDNAKTLEYLNYIDRDKFYHKINDDCSENDGINVERPIPMMDKINQENNIIDTYLVNMLLLKLKKNIGDIQNLYRDINNDRNFNSFKNALRMILYKE